MAIGLAGYSYTRTLGRKRVAVSNNVEATPLKMMYNGRISLNSERSPLEALPMDILVQVLCGVDHEDLNQLFHVSKTVREAVLKAKELHFGYSTPKKKIFAFLTPFDLEGANDEFMEIEAPNAPLRKSKSRLNGKLAADIRMALFANMDEDEDCE